MLLFLTAEEYIIPFHQLEKQVKHYVHPNIQNMYFGMHSYYQKLKCKTYVAMCSIKPPYSTVMLPSVTFLSISSPQQQHQNVCLCWVQSNFSTWGFLSVRRASFTQETGDETSTGNLGVTFSMKRFVLFLHEALNIFQVILDGVDGLYNFHYF